MKSLSFLPIILNLALMSVSTAAEPARTGNGNETYQTVPGWCQLPAGQTELGEMHGGVVVGRDGTVYFSTDTKRSIMAYAPDGRFLRSFGEDYVRLHSLCINVEDGQEYIYGAHHTAAEVVKFKTDGTLQWVLGWPEESGLYKSKSEYKPTAVAIAPNGDIYVADGYGKSYIHHYSKDRKYLGSFGGKGNPPEGLNVCHGISLDTRGPKPLLLVSDRENNRLVHFDLDGKFAGVVCEGLRRPCAVSIHGQHVAVAELAGRVTIVDGQNHIIAFLGDNPDKSQWASYPVPPDKWQEGIFTAPHSAGYDANGNLYVTDWNKFGRISRLNRVYPE
jgi:outer membrane protein assembly factor BamB